MRKSGTKATQYHPYGGGGGGNLELTSGGMIAVDGRFHAYLSKKVREKRVYNSQGPEE